MPTTWTSLYALRPSMFRFPYVGFVNLCVGQQAVQSVNGPMGPTVASLRAYAKDVVDPNSDTVIHKVYWTTKRRH